MVALPGLKARPELIVPLGALLLGRSTLPEATLLEAAELATAIGNLALADRLLAGPAARCRLGHGAWRLGQVLARTRPSLALARLRETRRRGVRGWEDQPGSSASPSPRWPSRPCAVRGRRRRCTG